MARKARQRISYVLPLSNSTGGHRLGVNGLAVDSGSSILYSAGRDGAICAWDLHLDVENSEPPEFDAKLKTTPPSTLRHQVQAHTHWINDIALAHSNRALVSASSDITVKLWRPEGADGLPPQTIGLHSDYVKTLAVPSQTSDWIASGGLDRKISIWDLNGAGQKLGISVGDDDPGSTINVEKGSVYALAATHSIIASGGPEKTVRVWDANTGKRITKLVGHTDNIRDILISHDGTTIMTASSDRTVKVWSTTAGRCMYTLTMHDASVWSLFSPDPDLSVFYSSDKNGLVAKTDARKVVEFDEGLSVAICQEHEGVHKIVAAGDSLWTATSRPSINRWSDVNTDNLEIDVPDKFGASNHRHSIMTHASRFSMSHNRREQSQGSSDYQSPQSGRRKIPLRHVLRLSNTAYFPVPVLHDSEITPHGSRRATIGSQDSDYLALQAVRQQPDGSIEGQNGLIKHVMMSDRRRVLTLDTAGEVVMWDLLKCVPIRSYGKRHLEDVKDEETIANTTIANWCTVDTRTGSLAVVLEENTCFDAEMYADELQLDDAVEFKEDARINLGKWVLRYLFANFIDEEIRRDNSFRDQLLNAQERQKSLRENAPSSIQLPTRLLTAWQSDSNGPSSASTIRPNTNGTNKVPSTPGFSIGLATPTVTSPVKTSAAPNPLAPIEDQEQAEDQEPPQTGRSSGEKEGDYFSTPRLPSTELATPAGASATAATPSESQDSATPLADGNAKETPTPGLFGKKFRMGMSFGGMKKLGRTQTNEKQAVVEEKDDTASKSSKESSRGLLDDNLHGLVQRMRLAYEESLLHQTQSQQARENGLPVPAASIELPSSITPSLPDETPVLKLPSNTTILIQEDRPEAGGVADLFEGTVGALGEQCDLVEKAAPTWLGEALLKNRIPPKDIVKTSFILEPWQNILPSISSDNNNRLNANRMLRAKKIMAYVAERIEPQPTQKDKEKQGDAPDANALKPEEYLELWCQDELVPPTMTLYTIRTHLWKGPGNDVVLHYKANGRKPIANAPQATRSAIPFSKPGAEPTSVPAE